MSTNEEYLRKVKRSPGRPKTTWMQTVRHDLAKIGIKLDLSKEAQTLNRQSELKRDRKNWRGIVRRAVQYQLRVTFKKKRSGLGEAFKRWRRPFDFIQKTKIILDYLFYVVCHHPFTIICNI